eukprot:TRINITY_DN13734_c0_g1_i1.p2 TRINITY_DN13734_c0_g1~~TRINITY_DN13734_c0_g1_i1.p2  ORF type:complete len:152 (+),score=40.82 TRINITY_DN13734_c0_g1_i1:385-840(+)
MQSWVDRLEQHVRASEEHNPDALDFYGAETPEEPAAEVASWCGLVQLQARAAAITELHSRVQQHAPDPKVWLKQCTDMLPGNKAGTKQPNQYQGFARSLGGQPAAKHGAREFGTDRGRSLGGSEPASEPTSAAPPEEELSLIHISEPTRPY